MRSFICKQNQSMPPQIFVSCAQSPFFPWNLLNLKLKNLHAWLQLNWNVLSRYFSPWYQISHIFKSSHLNQLLIICIYAFDIKDLIHFPIENSHFYLIRKKLSSRKVHYERKNVIFFRFSSISTSPSLYSNHISIIPLLHLKVII